MPKAARTSAAVLVAGSAIALGLAVAALVSSNGSAALATGTTSETDTSETETSEQATMTKYRAAIGPGAEVPKPIGVRRGAAGTFAVTLTKKSGDYSLTWKLTYRNLTGRADAAHIHRARVGKAGPVVVPLCGPCRSGKTGHVKISKAVAGSIGAGLTYVNIHTAKNKAGEIRGQVRKAG